MVESALKTGATRHCDLHTLSKYIPLAMRDKLKPAARVYRESPVRASPNRRTDNEPSASSRLLDLGSNLWEASGNIDPRIHVAAIGSTLAAECLRNTDLGRLSFHQGFLQLT